MQVPVAPVRSSMSKLDPPKFGHNRSTLQDMIHTNSVLLPSNSVERKSLTTNLLLRNRVHTLHTQRDKSMDSLDSGESPKTNYYKLSTVHTEKQGINMLPTSLLSQNQNKQKLLFESSQNPMSTRQERQALTLTLSEKIKRKIKNDKEKTKKTVKFMPSQKSLLNCQTM